MGLVRLWKYVQYVKSPLSLMLVVQLSFNVVFVLVLVVTLK